MSVHPTERNPDLLALLNEANAGDASAKKKLLAAIYEDVSRITSRIFHKDFQALRRVADTTDLAHEAYLRVAVYLEDGIKIVPRDEAQLNKLFRKIIHRTLIDLIRSLRGPRGYGANEMVGGPDPDLFGKTDGRMLRDARLDLSELLDALPEEDRLIVELRHFEKLEVNEIAEILGVDRATVRRRMRRILSGLGESLDPDFSGLPSGKRPDSPPTSAEA